MSARDRLNWIDAMSLDTRVPAEAFRLAHVLQSRFINDKTGEAWPGQKTIAALLNINDRQVRYHIEKLIGLGWLEKQRGGGGATNTYRLTGNAIATQGGGLTGNGTVVDRQWDGHLTGNGIADKLVENSPMNVGGGAKPTPDNAVRSNVASSSTFEGSRDAGLPAASPTINEDDDYLIPGVGTGWVERVLSRHPTVLLVCIRDDEGIASWYEVHHGLDGQVTINPTSPAPTAFDYSTSRRVAS